jgi:hypothetical protein
VNQEIAQLTNWLVIGPFANIDEKGMETIYAPEKEIAFGKIYQGTPLPITWTIPKVEILGDLIDPLPWGTNYTWNYHNGGVAWAMQQLSEVTGEVKYNQYATNFCDFHINGAPFVDYQVKNLRAVNSANNGFLFSPLLDFTLAPALPFIYILRKDDSFANREAYQTYIDRMLKYAKDEQVRFKQLILACSCMLLTTSAFGQIKAVEEFLAEHEKGLEKFYVYQSSLRMLNQKGDEAFNKLIKDIRKINIYISENAALESKAGYHKMVNALLQDDFETLVSAKEGSVLINFLGKESRNKTYYVLAFTEEDSFAVLEMDGKLDLRYLSAIESLDFDKLRKIVGQENAPDGKDGDQH